MIKYHIYPSQLVSNEEITDKAKLRFYNKLKDEVIDVIMLAHADRNMMPYVQSIVVGIVNITDWMKTVNCKRIIFNTTPSDTAVATM